MNRHRLFNNTNTPAGGIIGSKRVLTSSSKSNGDNGTVTGPRHYEREPDFHTATTMTMQRGVRGRTGLYGSNSNVNTNSNSNCGSNSNSNLERMNQLSLQMKHFNDDASDPINQISEIADSMYLCGARALKAPRIRSLGITTIFNVTVDLPNLQIDKVELIKIPIEDSPASNLSVYFDKVADKINEVVQRRGKVLVHCMAGISRSASLCIAYLMKHKRMSLRRAYRHVKNQRSIVHPNPGFFRQLIDYEMKLFGSTSMSIVFNTPNRRQDSEIYEQSSDSFAATTATKHNDTQNKYRTYISRPLELPVRTIIHKYGRQ